MSVDSEADLRFVKLAIQIAKRGLGQTGSNPSVGCIIVKNQRIIGRGVTGKGGVPHAEVIALGQAGSEAQGATAFVSLEPCVHHGKTGPCVDKLIAASISRVVCPLTDPDPRVSGGGFEKLKASNIIVDFIPEARQLAEEIVLGFSSRIKKNRPFVTVKLGLSFDGKIASKNGTSKWITNVDARRSVQLLRAQSDAILVGTNTFLKDNPNLTVRGALKNFVQPLRVLLDRNLSVLSATQCVKSLKVAPTIIACGSNQSTKKFDFFKKNNIEILKITEADNRLNLRDLLKILAQKGINCLLVEGGGEVVGSLISDNLVDRIVEYRSGVILGANGVNSVGELKKSFREIEHYPKFIIKSVRQLQNNTEIIWESSC